MKITYFLIIVIFAIYFCYNVYEKFTDTKNDISLQIIKNFLDEKEILSILNECNKFYNSKTVSKTGNKVSEWRTSTTCSLSRNSVAHKLIGEKIKLLGFDPNKLETLQLTKYLEGQQYKEHYDYFNEYNPTENRHLLTNGQRLATLFVYLRTPEEGGETYFNLLDKKLKLNKGDALFWKNCEKLEDGKYKYFKESKHSGLPVLKGYKIGMNIWITDKNRS